VKLRLRSKINPCLHSDSVSVLNQWGKNRSLQSQYPTLNDPPMYHFSRWSFQNEWHDRSRRLHNAGSKCRKLLLYIGAESMPNGTFWILVHVVLLFHVSSMSTMSCGGKMSKTKYRVKMQSRRRAEVATNWWAFYDI
jgi:hypothetical protein